MGNYEYIIMPFGKYRGEYLGDIPKKYLQWLYDNVELYGELAEAVEDIISEDED